jgi:hypothetical protein
MPKYLTLNENLCLIEQEVKTTKIVTVRESVNHIWIYDRSGSMYDALPELTKQLIQLAKKIPMNDYLTLGWFSSEGDYNWILKGFKITDKSDYKLLEKSIKDNSTTRGCTCFSEILTNTSTVIQDLSVFSKTFALHFFTDGYPVVSNHKKEIDNIFSAIQNIKGKIHTAMLIGYGYYFNKELMNKMAEKLGALLISSSLISEYTNSITKLIQLTDSQEQKEDVEVLDDSPIALFSVTDQGVVTYAIDENGKLLVSPQKGKKSYVYYISSKKPNTKNWTKVDVTDLNFSDADDKIVKALYGATLMLTQQTRTDISLDVIGKTGDKAIVDALTNAFTIEEYSRAEDIINKCLSDVSLRFSNGRDLNYLPPIDAFCVLDLVKMLMDDDETAFYPYHEKFEYEKIGVASETKEGFAKFEADKRSKCPFSNLTWNESRLNLSVLTEIQGTVNLLDFDGKKASDVKLINPFPTKIFRNYTLVKDGRVHTKKLFISSSEATYKICKNKGLVFEDTFKTDKIYGLDMSTLPVVNRKIATGKTSATKLCEDVLEMQKLKAKVKTLKSLKKELGVEVENKTNYTDEQVDFLFRNGIDINKGNIFSPPKSLAEAKDKYIAKTFDISIKGLNSLPTVKKVMEKIAAKKKLTPVEVLIQDGIEEYETVKRNNSKELSNWLESSIKENQNKLKVLRVNVQENKFAVILGKKWFDEFKSREDTKLTIGENEFEFVLGEEEVEI